MKAKELRDKTGDELVRLQGEREKDVINFRLQVATGVVDNVRAARMARRDIARIKTVLRQRELAAANKGGK